MDEGLVVQMPAEQAAQLFLLFHGVGATEQDMAALGRRLATTFPAAAVVCVRSPSASDLGQGFQWFSVMGITEDNRAARIAAAMPAFTETVRRWQQQTGVQPAATALVGFSQGAIMALESTQLQLPRPLCGRVVALSGRFAGTPAAVGPETTVHLVHGKQDAVVPYAHTVRAAEQLVALGSDVTADVIPFLGHTISAEVEALVVERLTGYIPQERWRQALRGAPES